MGAFYATSGTLLAASLVALCAVVTDEAWATVLTARERVADVWADYAGTATMAATAAQIGRGVREAIGDTWTWVRGWWGVTGRHVAMRAPVYRPRHMVGAA